jgi:hypothetical protein
MKHTNRLLVRSARCQVKAGGACSYRLLNIRVNRTSWALQPIWKPKWPQHVLTYSFPSWIIHYNINSCSYDNTDPSHRVLIFWSVLHVWKGSGQIAVLTIIIQSGAYNEARDSVHVWNVIQTSTKLRTSISLHFHNIGLLNMIQYLEVSNEYLSPKVDTAEQTQACLSRLYSRLKLQ